MSGKDRQLERFDDNTIREALKTKWVGETIHFSQETDSTNLRIRALAAEGCREGALAVAELQTAGRGRLGRSWTAPAGTSIAMSLLLRPAFAPERASMLTLVMGLSVAEACRHMGLEVSIKWPNDVVIGGKKLCGILTEMQLCGAAIDHVVIGTGINVNLTEFPEELRETATSIQLETGHEADRNLVLSEVLSVFENNYERFLETQDLTLLKESYERLLVNRDRIVRVLDPLGAYTGTARGINARGALLVEREDGTLEEVSSGEVSVRGIYGYV